MDTFCFCQCGKSAYVSGNKVKIKRNYFLVFNSLSFYAIILNNE